MELPSSSTDTILPLRNNLPSDWYPFLLQQAGSRRSGRLFWPVLVLVLLVLNLYAPAQPTIAERLLASGIVLVALSAIWVWMYRGRGKAEFGFLPVFLLVYSLQYALPVFTLKIYSMQVFTTESLPDEAVEKALLMALIGLAAVLFGYYYPGRTRVAGLLPQIRMPWRSKYAVQIVSVFFAAMGLAIFFVLFTIKLPDEVQAYAHMPSELFFLGIIALFIIQLEGELSWIYFLLLWLVFIPLRSVIGLAQGALGFAIFEAASLLIAFATVRRRIPWVIFFFGFAALLFMQPIKASMRSMVFVGGQANGEQDQSEKFSALAATGELGLRVVQNLDPTDLLAMASQRLASIMVFATVVSQTPENVPYWQGSSYYPLLLVAIPRFLYRDKPLDSPGNIMGHKYGMIQPNDYSTSINSMQLLELYGNFGPLGVILGSIIIGIIYRTLNDLFLHAGSGLGALVGGIYLFSHLADIENATSGVFGGLLLESMTVITFYYTVRFADFMFEANAFRKAARSHAHQNQFSKVIETT